MFRSSRFFLNYFEDVPTLQEFSAFFLDGDFTHTCSLDFHWSILFSTILVSYRTDQTPSFRPAPAMSSQRGANEICFIFSDLAYFVLCRYDNLGEQDYFDSLHLFSHHIWSWKHFFMPSHQLLVPTGAFIIPSQIIYPTVCSFSATIFQILLRASGSRAIQLVDYL